MSDTDPAIDPLTILLSRLSRDVLLPEERDQLRAMVGELKTEHDRLTARLEQADLDAEQQDRHFRTVVRERESYRQSWKAEQKRRATAEATIARVQRLLDTGPIGTCCDHLVRAALKPQPTTEATR